MEISKLKTRIKTLEDAQTTRGDVQEDAPNRGGIMDQGEDFGIERDSNKSTDKGSESTGEMAMVLSCMEAANILASRGLKDVFTTASPPVPPMNAQTQGRHKHDQEFDAEITTVGAEVDDIAAKT
ncbi:hypothetical protein Tco_0874462 [Tanacetum coccineum]|uniref:Uncharacterized protein n=1 Tax=Tanacetum coccineum TaxID=301880 RepID=A0ABQ5BLN8_9ASTR